MFFECYDFMFLECYDFQYNYSHYYLCKFLNFCRQKLKAFFKKHHHIHTYIKILYFLVMCCKYRAICIAAMRTA